MLYYKLGFPPTTKPFRLRLEDGLTVTDPTEEQLEQEGWLVAPDYPENTYPSIVEWGLTNWIVRDPNDEEIISQWHQVKNTCKQKLAETDYKVIKAVESTVLNGTTLEQELPLSYIEYRQALRDIYNNVNNLDPFFVQWPTLQESTNGDQLS